VKIRNFLSRNGAYFWAALAILAIARVYWEAYFHSTDLHVYWRTAHWWLKGISPYVYDETDRANVFKYPPWTVPLFLPLGFMSYNVTRMVWVTLEILTIGYSIRWLIRAGVDQNVTYFMTALYWWTWFGHIYSGQFTLFILFAALWAVPPEKNAEITSGKVTFLAIVLSSKVYSIFTMLGVFRAAIRPRTILISLTSVVLLEALVIAVLRFHGNEISIIDLHRTWIQAAESGAAELGAHVVRGQGNHSFTAGVLRWFHVDPLDSSKDGYVALILGVFFSAIWFYFSQHLARAEQWAGWIGVGMVVHPLLWHHSFVLAFPICALSLDRAIRDGSRALIALAGLGTFLIAIFIPNIFGMEIVTPLELYSSKSWGIVFAASVLVVCQNRKDKLSLVRSAF
jgi:hypothetical protein